MSVQIDPKHGVNPSLDMCFYCQEARGVALLGKLTTPQKRVFAEAGVASHDQDEAPRQLCYSMEPCDTCKGHMEKGIIVISVKDEDEDEGDENPFRTGGWVVLREEALERIIDNSPELLADIKKRRVVFMPDGAWDMVGLPREEQQAGG